MRITTFLLSVCVMSLVAINTNSQNARVTISKNAAHLDEVLNEIESQTDYLFIYNNQVDVTRNVTVKVKSQPVNEVLSKLLKNTDIDYSMEGTHIVLSKRNADTQIAQQDTRTVSGVVSDNKGETIIGANVVEKGTTNGVITDIDGKFSLSVRSGAILVISYVGYLTQEVTVGNRTSLAIELLEDSKAIDEVVVIGYGTARKSDLTGALTSVTAAQFEDQKITRVDQILQGRASGVQISNTVGAPGGDVRIRIRGVNSVLGDNSPLFVIDGFVGGDFNMLNPNDIQSIEVLKDASSTAIYGSRGANGVILVTTKSGGNTGKVTVNYQGDVSFSSVIKTYDVLDAADFATLVNEKNSVYGLKDSFSADEIANYRTNGGFDYQNAIFRTAVSTQHQIGLTGGTDKTQYRISGNYLNQEGVIENSNYSRYTVRTNFLTKFNDHISFRFNINGASMTGMNTQARTGAGNPLVQALAWAPTTYPYDDNGGYLISDPIGSIKTNPLAIMYDSENISERAFANLMGGIRYTIIDGLSADFQVGADLLFVKGKNFSGNYASNYSPSASINNTKTQNIQTTSQISYDKVLNEIHRINAVIAVETQKYTSSNSSSSSSNLKFADLKYDNLAQAQSYSVGSGYNQWTLLSYLGRVNYSLLDRYLFSVAVRRDGSSKFAEGNKFSTFPSAAIAWNIRNEAFMENVDWLSKLKLRVSWGLTGSQAISAYATLSAYDTGIYYAYTTDDRTSGIQLGNPGNIDLKWETTEQKDLGLEIGLFQGRLNVEVDYFIKNTRDLLLNKSVPYYIGGGSITANVGEIKNQGWELSVGGTILNTKAVAWESNFNISNVKNEVVDLGDEQRIFNRPDINGMNGQPEFVYEVGKPLGTFWGLKYLGPWKSGQEAEAAKYNNIPGDARYEDKDGNGSIDGDDYQIIGCGLPTTTLGWNNTLNVKNFTLNVFFQGVFDIDKQNYTRAMHLMGDRDARQATLSEIKERYIPGVNETAYLPAFSKSSRLEPQSTMFLEDASYVRLKNLSLGYNFNLKNIGNLKVSLNATNLLTFTKYKGLDPESSSVGGGGSDIVQSVDYGSYPNSKTYTIGVDFTF